MNRRFRNFMVHALLVSALLIHYSISRAADQTLEFGKFGTVHLYSGKGQPSRVAILVSGDEGWTKGVVDMAQDIARHDALVVGVDITHYLPALDSGKGPCSYPAADFEDLSKYVQKSQHFSQYMRPVLIGYSSGATLVYASLAQAPSTTFSGAVSLGFCPDLAVSKSLCKGYGLQSTAAADGKSYSFQPTATMQPPWVVLQGANDTTCAASATESYVKQIPTAKLVMLPKVGHGYSEQHNWMPQLLSAFTQICDAHEAQAKAVKPLANSDVKDLPLIEVPAKGTPSSTMAVIVTGDGGWASLDKDIGNSLASKGISVVGFDSLQYFWTKRTPETAAADLQRVLQHYLNEWKKDNAMLIGYSLGADVLPFMTSRLSAEVRSRVSVLALVGPSVTVDFEFHLTDWIGNVTGNISHDTDRPILPELKKLKGTKVLCLYGSDDTETVCDKVESDVAVAVKMGGGHHFGGNYDELADRILKEAGGTTTESQSH